MNLFESELQQIFGTKFLQDAVTQGKSMIGKIDDILRAKITWEDAFCIDNFNALRVDIINRTEGLVDTKRFLLSDLWGKKQIRPGFEVFPHIWVSEKTEWYAYVPTNAERMALKRAVGEYIDIFR